MSPVVEDFEDIAVNCSRCAGEAMVIIVINKEFVCTDCARTGRRECA